MTHEIDWNDPILKKWMDSIARDGTKTIYRSHFPRYVEFTKLTPHQMIDEAIEDSKKDVLQSRIHNKRTDGTVGN